MPTPGHGGVVGDHGQVSLALADQLIHQRSGVPTPMNPPIMTLAPSGIWETAFSIAIVPSLPRFSMALV